MAENSKSAPGKPKRRVTVARKPAIPEVSPAILCAISAAVEAQGLEQMKKIILEQEVQLNALRCVMFDLLVFTREHSPLSARSSAARIRDLLNVMRTTLEANCVDLKSHHKDANQIDDLDVTNFLPVDASDLTPDSITPADVFRMMVDVDQRLRGDEEVSADQVADVDNAIDRSLDNFDDDDPEMAFVESREHPQTRKKAARKKATRKKTGRPNVFGRGSPS